MILRLLISSVIADDEANHYFPTRSEWWVYLNLVLLSNLNLSDILQVVYYDIVSIPVYTLRKISCSYTSIQTTYILNTLYRTNSNTHLFVCINTYHDVSTNQVVKIISKSHIHYGIYSQIPAFLEFYSVGFYFLLV